MNILGISCFYHDSAACLIRDGAVVAAASEERFTRKKHSADFPVHAANYCLQAGGITINDIDYVGFYEKPFLKFSRLIQSHIGSYPSSLSFFMKTMPLWLQDRLIMPIVMKRELGYEGKTLFVKHHLSHAASSFLVSPFEEAAVVTADSVGEWATITLGTGRGTDIRVLKEMRFPHSLGLLYTAVTTYLGFGATGCEGKVMGLASYGKPAYLDEFRKMVSVYPDGSFAIDPRFFGFNTGNRMYTKRFVEAFGPERAPESAIEQRHCDMAATIQTFTEETLLLIARHLHALTKQDKLCLAGGIFLNCVANQRILEETPFKEVFIQPAAGDSGGALGVASYIYHSLLKNPRTQPLRDAYLGPAFSDSEIRRALANAGLAYRELDDESLLRYTARAIADDKVVGWLQGRMEFGPRALGGRSILANACAPGMKDHLNEKVKKRESFRPFAPVVPEECAHEYFELDRPSPYMLLSPRVREDKRSVIPSVTHVDGTARVQTVNRDRNPRLWGLVREFEKLTGVPVIINTSFNLRGEPIVCTPRDAVACFRNSGMDCLVMGNFVTEKEGRTL